MWFDLCSLPYFLRLLLGLFRAGVPGRLVPVGSGCVSRRRAMSRASTYPSQRHGVGVESSALARPSGRRDVQRRLETEVSAPVGEVGRSRKAGTIPPRPGLPVGDWIALLAYCLDTWAGPMSCTLSAWAEPLLGSRSTRDLGFMNPIISFGWPTPYPYYL